MPRQDDDYTQRKAGVSRSSCQVGQSRRPVSALLFFFFFKQKTAYEIGLGIPAEPLFRSMLGTFVKDWFRYESHFVHGRDSLVDILKERGLLSESDAVQPLIGKKS